MRYIGFALLFFLMVGWNPASAKPIAHHIVACRKKQIFDCPQVIETAMANNPSTCNAADGSITGIYATGNGTISYLWYDTENTVRSQISDLLGVGPGVYKLVVRDQSKCPAVIKFYIVGVKNAPEIDSSYVKYTKASCAKNTGAIKHLHFINVVKFQWLDRGGAPIQSDSTLTGVSSDLYTLVVTNADGCQATMKFQVPSADYFPTPEAKIDTTLGICGYSESAVTITFYPPDNNITYTYAAIDDFGGSANNDQGPITGGLSYANGQPVKITMPAGPLGHPNHLIIFNQDNCPSIVGNYELPEPTFKISTKGAVVRNDACGRHTGGVFNLKLLGGSPPGIPSTQQWYWSDTTGKVVFRLPDLTDVTKGTYHLKVVDIHGCTDTMTFRINDSTAEALPPQLVANTTLCLPGTITISVTNPGAKLSYRLYDSTQTAVTENKFGIFQQFAAQTSTYYVTAIDGLCESDKTPYMVTVIAPGVIIPNTFTPNNDGINDYWNIPHINQFPGAEVSIYNREGLLIYHSIDYGKAFDGKYNGKLLPSGVYYYVIDLKQPECLGKVSGNLTLIR